MLIKSDLQYMYISHVDRGKINDFVDFVYMYGTFKVRIASTKYMFIWWEQAVDIL